jgi:hypothetical protein
MRKNHEIHKHHVLIGLWFSKDYVKAEDFYAEK